MAKPTDLVDARELAKFCEQVWGRQAEPEAAAYFVRLMERQIIGFTGYLPGSGKVTRQHVYTAASRYYE